MLSCARRDCHAAQSVSGQPENGVRSKQYGTNEKVRYRIVAVAWMAGSGGGCVGVDFFLRVGAVKAAAAECGKGNGSERTI